MVNTNAKRSAIGPLSTCDNLGIFSHAAKGYALKRPATGPLICMSLNKNSLYCVMPRSVKSADTVDRSGPAFCSCSYLVTSFVFDYCRHEYICGSTQILSGDYCRYEGI